MQENLKPSAPSYWDLAARGSLPKPV